MNSWTSVLALARAASTGAPGAGTPRVVQVIPSLQVGGLQKTVVRLVHHFGPRIEHLVLTPAGDGPLRTTFPEGVPVLSMAERRLSGKWNALGMACIFRAYRPDIVHARNWTCIDAIVGARLAAVPIVIHGEHGREASDPEGRNRFRRRARRWLSPL
ncbi:MAG TPA: glycosyltransferase, partial [Gemmatimonadales bacterium]|nr:glycosyltransferase [Gemmatimonadales bacterium]